MTEPWVSVDDVAYHLGVAKDTVYRWIEGRSMPAHCVGRLWKFELSEVGEWVRAGGADAPKSRGGQVSTRSMDVFSLRDTVVEEYKKFTTSFTTIHAEDIRQQIEAIYAENRYWPEPLIQINPNYGILLAPHLDAAFDRGFITLADDGAVMVSPDLSDEAREVLGLNQSLRAHKLADGHRQYLPWHRDKVFRHLPMAGRQDAPT